MDKLAPATSNVNRTPPASGPTPDLPRDVANLAMEMRAAVTPVIGYLELISGEGDVSADRRLQWIATIERRLEAIQELNDQIARTCAVLREYADGREAAMPPGFEAPSD